MLESLLNFYHSLPAIAYLVIAVGLFIFAGWLMTTIGRR